MTMFGECVYLDNAAATRLDERVLEAMKPYLFETYAVATSQFGYSPGIEARDTLDAARTAIAGALGAEPEEFIFTSGSTESSNIAIKGVAMALGTRSGDAEEDFPRPSGKGKHIIVHRFQNRGFPRSPQRQGSGKARLPGDLSRRGRVRAGGPGPIARGDHAADHTGFDSGS